MVENKLSLNDKLKKTLILIASPKLSFILISYFCLGSWRREICLSTTVSCYLQEIKNINLLKHTGRVMHQQFNIQQLYALPTLYLCVLYLSENKQRLVPLTA
jgi:hypothetical protein